MKRTDWLLIGGGAVLAGAVVWYTRQGFVSLGDALASARRQLGQAASVAADKLNPASPGNAVYTAASAAASAAAGRDTSPGSLLADIAPSEAERELNKPGFWINQGRPKISTAPVFPDIPTVMDPPFEVPGTIKQSGNPIYGDQGAMMVDALGNVIN